MKKLMLLSMLSMFASCGGMGKMSLTAWGEDYIEQEIPAAEFEDGHTVKFTKFLVVVNEFTLATKTGMSGPAQTKPILIDVHKAGPIELERLDDVPAQKWDAVSWAIMPSADAVVVGDVSADDAARMKNEGYSVWVEGTVSKGLVTKNFAWGFKGNTKYSDCSSEDLGEGVTIPTGGTEVVQLTIHGDHFFYDDLQSPDAKLRGDALVKADADLDGMVTMTELNAVSLTTLPVGQYGTGGASQVKSLGDFVTALSRTIGHFRGEGECVTTPR
ncbi:MAG: hypothetical protein DI536_30790 [Archangium gephyra]|uniref:Lipoprotein n=1 Tax=Archangium gephyra TaxID=48 RepID=A0A2W5T3M6_9BACT|nr:MAG: hypothetical protein DI536_30790 [Archangium gephyra]